MLTVQGHDRARGKRFAWKQLVGGMHLSAGLVIHDDEFCFVQIEYFAKLLGKTELEISVARGEGLVISNPDQFLGIGLNVVALGQRQTERRGSENIGDKPKALSIPRI